MIDIHAGLIVVVVSLVTIGLRFLPFFVFGASVPRRNLLHIWARFCHMLLWGCW